MNLKLFCVGTGPRIEGERRPSHVMNTWKSDWGDQHYCADLNYIQFLSQSQASSSLANSILPHYHLVTMRAMTEELIEKECGRWVASLPIMAVLNTEPLYHWFLFAVSLVGWAILDLMLYGKSGLLEEL